MKFYAITDKEASEATIIKSRIHNWLAHETLENLFGVQVKVEDQSHRYFLHVMAPSMTPILFKRYDEAKEFEKNLKLGKIRAEDEI